MEGEEDNSQPPFWLQSDNSLRRNERLRQQLRRSNSIFLSSSVFLLALIVLALAFFFIVIPTILSFASQIFRPNLVKRSWDSLNFVLVLFAIVCGFLSRNTNNDGSGSSSYEDRSSVSNRLGEGEATKSNQSTPRQWFDTDRTESFSRLRSSSSYPDLRQESPWASRDERWRFYDDTNVRSFRVSGSDQLHHRRPWQGPEEESETKTISVDTFVVAGAKEDSVQTPEPAPEPPSSPPPSPPPPRPEPDSLAPPPESASTPPSKVVIKRKAKRNYQSIERREGENSHPLPSWQPPPPVPMPEYYELEHKNGKSEKKRGIATKEFITSALRRKKKKQRQKSVENFDKLLSSFPSSSSYPPPPPPPPPPPSAFHNFFSSKKGKSKTVRPLSQPPPPPPLPSPVDSRARVSRSKAQSRPIPIAQKPPLPVQTSNFNGVEENPNSGGESSLIPNPPPPPPPPFKMPELKFVKQGDFVRIKSNDSSRSGSPELDRREDSPSKAMSPLDDVESPSAMFCSSPDVDTKADNFIARFRAGLKLEKMNSLRVKSRLGP